MESLPEVFQTDSDVFKSILSYKSTPRTLKIIKTLCALIQEKRWQEYNVFAYCYLTNMLEIKMNDRIPILIGLSLCQEVLIAEIIGGSRLDKDVSISNLFVDIPVDITILADCLEDTSKTKVNSHTTSKLLTSLIDEQRVLDHSTKAVNGFKLRGKYQQNIKIKFGDHKQEYDVKWMVEQLFLIIATRATGLHKSHRERKSANQKLFDYCLSSNRFSPQQRTYCKKIYEFFFTEIMNTEEGYEERYWPFILVLSVLKVSPSRFPNSNNNWVWIAKRNKWLNNPLFVFLDLLKEYCKETSLMLDKILQDTFEIFGTLEVSHKIHLDNIDHIVNSYLQHYSKMQFISFVRAFDLKDLNREVWLSYLSFEQSSATPQIEAIVGFITIGFGVVSLQKAEILALPNKLSELEILEGTSSSFSTLLQIPFNTISSLEVFMSSVSYLDTKLMPALAEECDFEFFDFIEKAKDQLQKDVEEKLQQEIAHMQEMDILVANELRKKSDLIKKQKENSHMVKFN